MVSKEVYITKDVYFIQKGLMWYSLFQRKLVITELTNIIHTDRNPPRNEYGSITK